MVSLRRRRLLGLCSGKNSVLDPFSSFPNHGRTPEDSTGNAKPVKGCPLPLNNGCAPKEETTSDTAHGSPDLSVSSQSREKALQVFPGIKHRKRYKRKLVQDQEPCTMRGVYFKNRKWQAAIKVDKKQIHLGTVASEEEAARLYDRAAFMCGREPNFELSKEEKQELRKYSWDEFLAVTRHAIANKKNQKRTEPQSQT
ncbi:ethylene-responsive transcription factor-like protein At4g13040 [Andrographis paniculata]|uniref:ethylene-responsive transcription factor-like protein At4g13040 n=1 Tax=Andrographis paniculata TaxID=175694 RepID=UPI0021E81823|nr:ethylene-responsive transcription factor-like protein At4g13040 [Andrographis paniculata]XP_051143644.1 ethylene-responsive transcription factor-like protein At4g13040 [Andrographis paniculata]